MLLIGWSKFPTNQKHYPYLCSDVSSVLNFCSPSSEVISRGKPPVVLWNVECFLRLQSWTKFLAHLHFWSVFQFTHAQPLPSPHKQRFTRVSTIFQVSTLFSKKELLEYSEKGALLYEGTQKMPKNMNTVLLSQGLLSMILGSKTMVISKKDSIYMNEQLSGIKC